MGESRAVLNEFLAESRENLDRLDRDLVAVEAEPGRLGTLDQVFRTFHNIKGACGFLDLDRPGALAHAAEGLLARLRDGSIPWDHQITTALLDLADAVRLDLAAVEARGDEADDDDDADAEIGADHRGLIKRLARLGEPKIEPAPEPEPETAPPLVFPEGEAGGSRYLSGGRGGAIRPPSPRGSRGEGPHPPDMGAGADRSRVPVDVELLDRLMGLVGELVLARNQVLQHSEGWPDAGLARDALRLSQVTSALQDGVLKARLRPIGTTWDRIPRLARDLAIARGKQVRVEAEGGTTELDRTVIEAIRDPITHLVRNAVDHGVEAPEDRIGRGKPPVGRLILRATHQGGLVHVEVEDDGRGIDPARVAAGAVAAGLITPEQAARVDPEQAARLVFEPGFSTADAVTEVSGRGVGLDVDRANVEAIGGTVEVRSRPGAGTTFTLKVPLTLAIIPALVVSRASGERYAIPQAALVELIRVEADGNGNGNGNGSEGGPPAWSVQANGAAVFLRGRGDLIPLIDLDHALGDARRPIDGRDGRDVVVAQGQGVRFALAVDQIRDTEEIVVKPLGRAIRHVPHFAGVTILRDGHVALILDVAGLARSQGLTTPRRERGQRHKPAPALPDRVTTPEPWEGPRSFLIVEAEPGRRLALPLEAVDRLEEVDPADVKATTAGEVLHHRGSRLPLIRAGGGPTSASTRAVICRREDGRPVALAVGSILDIVAADPRLEPAFGTPGVLGSSLFGGQLADLIDLDALARHAATAGGPWI